MMTWTPSTVCLRASLEPVADPGGDSSTLMWAIHHQVELDERQPVYSHAGAEVMRLMAPTASVL